MTIIEDKEDKSEIIREALRRITQEEEGFRPYTDEVVVDVKRGPEPNSIPSVFYALLSIAAPIAGCVMWFASVPLRVNVIILALSGIVGGILVLLSVSRDPTIKTGADIIVGAICIVLAPLAYLLVTVILVAIIESILWVGALLF